MWPSNEQRASYDSINLFCTWKQPESEVWQLRERPENADVVQAHPPTAGGNDDLKSLDSWTQSVVSKSSLGSTVSFESTAVMSSVNTTPADSPVSTPTLRRKLSATTAALKLTFDGVTWSISGKKRNSRRLRQNLQAGSKRVKDVMKQSKTPEFRLRMILLTLFALIVTIVSFTWHMYQRQLLQLTIGKKLRFHEAQRVLHLLTDDGREWVEATLGVSIPSDLKPYHCDIYSPFTSSHMCEEWKYRAKLHINFSHTSNMSCYFVRWNSLNEDTILRDCLSLRGAHWYGMGLQKRLRWPLGKTPGSELYPLVTGGDEKQMFGGVLDRYWISTDGVAVLVDSSISLFVSQTDENLCFESRNDKGYPYPKSVAKDNVLIYTICTGSDIRTLHQNMISYYRSPLEDSGCSEFLFAPVWSLSMGQNMTQRSVLEYANSIMEHSFRLPGFMLLDSRWQHPEGSLEFNRRTFPDPREILRILRNKGFRVLLTVHPYVCLPSKVFESAKEFRHLITDQWNPIPLLTRWREKLCGLIDITNNVTASWYRLRLTKLKQKYDIDGFAFIGGETSYLPRSYSFSEPLPNPDLFVTQYLSIAKKMSPLLGSEVGFLTQKFPGFIRISPRTVSWDNSSGLASVIPTVLTISMLGYPLVNPGPIGGEGTGEIPTKELYLRWFQLAVFLPVVHFTILPGHYDHEVTKVVHDLFQIRESLVVPVFKESLESFSSEPIPLIRPLWWIDPHDAHSQVCSTQFFVGQSLMVAPVLEEGKRTRDIYLPEGWWKDHQLREVRRGGKWLHNYPVPLTKVAYFSMTKEYSNKS